MKIDDQVESLMVPGTTGIVVSVFRKPNIENIWIRNDKGEIHGPFDVKDWKVIDSKKPPSKKFFIDETGRPVFNMVDVFNGTEMRDAFELGVKFAMDNLSNNEHPTATAVKETNNKTTPLEIEINSLKVRMALLEKFIGNNMLLINKHEKVLQLIIDGSSSITLAVKEHIEESNKEGKQNGR